MGVPKLHSNKVAHFLKNSYEKKRVAAPSGYTRDDSLSGQRVQVYSDKNGKAVVVHRGTAGMQDVKTDIKFMFGFKKGKRFQHSKKIQDAVHKKYGANNTTSLGHSLGGALAETAGKKSARVITLNKAANLETMTHKTPKHHTNIRSSVDVVSMAAARQKGGKHIKIKSKSLNPLKEHNVDILKRINKEI